MRYPYERFLRYLVSRKANVDRALEQIGLPPVGQLWVQKATTCLRASAPRTVAHYLDRPRKRPAFQSGFLEWAQAQEIRTLWENHSVFRARPDPALVQSEQLFFRPFTRAVLGMLILARLKRVDVVAIMKEKCELEIAEPVLGLYESIFWDHRQTTPAFWQDVLPRFALDERQGYAMALQSPAPGVSDIRRFLDIETRNEPRVELLKLISAGVKQYERILSTPHLQIDHRVAIQWANLVRGAARDSLANEKPAQATENPARSYELVSVRIEKTRHPTMAELDGEVSPRDDRPGGG